MKTVSLAAASSLLAFVAAVPLNMARDVVWTTDVVEVTETVNVWTTLWVSPGAEASSTAVSTPSSAPAVSTPSSVAAPVETSSYVAPSSSYVAPSSSYVAPSSSYVAPSSSAAATSTYVAPVPSSTYVAPSSSSSAEAAVASAASSDSTSSSNGATTHTGDITHWDVGQGSCGWTNSDSESVVAVPVGVMNNGANPNNNPLCGKTVSIQYQGKTTSAKVVDTCMGCADSALDLSPSLFTTVAPSGDGRVPDVTWWINN